MFYLTEFGLVHLRDKDVAKVYDLSLSLNDVDYQKGFLYSNAYDNFIDEVNSLIQQTKKEPDKKEPLVLTLGLSRFPGFYESISRKIHCEFESPFSDESESVLNDERVFVFCHVDRFILLPLSEYWGDSQITLESFILEDASLDKVRGQLKSYLKDGVSIDTFWSVFTNYEWIDSTNRFFENVNREHLHLYNLSSIVELGQLLKPRVNVLSLFEAILEVFHILSQTPLLQNKRLILSGPIASYSILQAINRSDRLTFKNVLSEEGQLYSKKGWHLSNNWVLTGLLNDNTEVDVKESWVLIDSRCKQQSVMDSFSGTRGNVDISELLDLLQDELIYFANYPVAKIHLQVSGNDGFGFPFLKIKSLVGKDLFKRINIETTA